MGDPSWRFAVFDKKFTAQQISAFILQKLKRDAEAYLGDTVTQAVITVPAYFDDAQPPLTWTTTRPCWCSTWAGHLRRLPAGHR